MVRLCSRSRRRCPHFSSEAGGAVRILAAKQEFVRTHFRTGHFKAHSCQKIIENRKEMRSRRNGQRNNVQSLLRKLSTFRGGASFPPLGWLCAVAGANALAHSWVGFLANIACMQLKIQAIGRLGLTMLMMIMKLFFPKCMKNIFFRGKVLLNMSLFGMSLSLAGMRLSLACFDFLAVSVANTCPIG